MPSGSYVIYKHQYQQPIPATTNNKRQHKHMLPTSQPHPSFDQYILHWLASVPEKPASNHSYLQTRGGRSAFDRGNEIGGSPHSPPATVSDIGMPNPDSRQSKKRPAGSSISDRYPDRPQPGNPPLPDMDALRMRSSTPIPPSASASTTSFDHFTQNSQLIFSPTPGHTAPESGPSISRKSSPTKSLKGGTSSRFLRTQLLRTIPKVRLGSPYYDGSDPPHIPPRHVTSIVKRFKEIIFGGGYVPGILKVRLFYPAWVRYSTVLTCLAGFRYPPILRNGVFSATCV